MEQKQSPQYSLNDKIKAGFMAAGGVSLLVLAYAAMVYAGAYSSSIEPGSFRSFSVSAEDKVVATPDVAKFSFTVISEGGKNIAAVQKDNVDKANRAISFLKAKGIEAKDIKTENYSLEPRYQTYNCQPSIIGIETSPCPPSEIVGYTIRQTVSVKVRDMAKLGDVVGGVVDNGANQVSGPMFVIDDPTKLQDEARAKAIAKAQAKADAIARAGGFSVGRLLGIDEGGQGGYYDKMVAYGRGGAMEAAAMPAPSIEPGSQDVTVSVVLRYEIR